MPPMLAASASHRAGTCQAGRERRRRLGKFFHRPPGGESWIDVGLRVRAVLDEIRSDCQDERVMIVAHQVVVLVVRYVVEGLTEAEILDIDRQDEIANCSVTSYRPVDGVPVLTRFNELPPLEEQHEPVTAEPDTPGAPR